MSEYMKAYKWSELLKIVDSKVEMHDETEYPLISIRRRNGGVFSRETLKGKNILTKTLSRTTPGSFVVSKMQVVHGACSYVSEAFANTYLSDSYLSFLPKDNEKIDTKYLHYYAHLPQSYEAFLRSSHGVHIEKMTFDLKDWFKSSATLPNIQVQQKIIEILTSVDEVIENTKSQINKLEDLKKATMNELLTKGIDHTEFKETEIGRIPREWKIKELGELGECIRGLTYSPNDIRDEGLLVLRSSNIQGWALSFDDCVYVIDNVEAKFLTKANDLLICVRNGSRSLLGKSVLIKNLLKKATHGAFMTVFRSPHNNYLQYYAQSNLYYRQISLDIGATINSINTGNLLKYRVPFPPEEERREIVRKLGSIDESLFAVLEKFKKFKKIKKSLMQDLLTGKVRVTVN